VVFIGRYIYRLLDTHASLFCMQPNLSRLRQEYRRLQGHLARTGWISHGYVQDRGPGAGGPCYQWTRKERKKTVSVALSKEQYLWMQEAIENWRQVQQTLKRMEQISREILFATIPEPPRRKPLTKQVLGLN
jgi:hypothetical protein